jgi:predicted alpha/beta hydrolase
MTTPLTFTVTTQDKYVLGASRYEPQGSTHSEIFLVGATGVPQGFYQRFAHHANAQGFAVTTFDYRGLGASAPKKLRGFRMNYLDWGRQDAAAVLDHITNTLAQGKPIYMVGHSYAAHGFGLMPNHGLIEKFYTFAGGAGWSGYMPFIERLKVEFLWRVLGPILTPLLGYMPGKLIGGLDLPLDVYRQWRHWCKFPNYFFDLPAMKPELRLFNEVRTPIMAVNADDDLWALPASRDAFFKGYTQAVVTPVTLESAKFGIKGIGHMGYFRRGSEPLWDDALAWFRT